jgi:hypothetical protein
MYKFLSFHDISLLIKVEESYITKVKIIFGALEFIFASLKKLTLTHSGQIAKWDRHGGFLLSFLFKPLFH